MSTNSRKEEASLPSKSRDRQSCNKDFLKEKNKYVNSLNSLGDSD
jgi:hypothetical protein